MKCFQNVKGTAKEWSPEETIILLVLGQGYSGHAANQNVGMPPCEQMGLSVVCQGGYLPAKRLLTKRRGGLRVPVHVCIAITSVWLINSLLSGLRWVTPYRPPYHVLDDRTRNGKRHTHSWPPGDYGVMTGNSEGNRSPQRVQQAARQPNNNNVCGALVGHWLGFMGPMPQPRLQGTKAP